MSEIWTKEKCITWIEKEVLSGKSTKEEFLNRLIDWHVAEYQKAGNPTKLDWADESLKMMQRCMQELGVDAVKRKSLFQQFKEEADGRKTPSGN